ncbi:MAG: flagellar FliJ family protein [Alphaproteobacteria bacterium]|nr:flagellar FliJ family protein [Alphaproteobacteria bacterium]
MKSREALVRLHRFRVDEIRKRLKSLDDMRGDLTKKMSDLETMMQEEQRRAAHSDLGRLAYPSFARSVQARRENIQRTLSEVERQAAQVTDELQAAYRELKKHEIAADNEQVRDRVEYARQVQSELDDIALGRHARKA